MTSAEEVVEALHKAIDDREEGLVLKDQSSVYKPGGRANSGWIKLKPDYENGLMDTVCKKIPHSSKSFHDLCPLM